MHSDLDGEITGAEWQWSKSRSKSGSYNAIADAEATTYSPVEPATWASTCAPR